ncbi:NADPH:quinone reductase [Jatrophihabitans sp. YIM 134969]
MRAVIYTEPGPASVLHLVDDRPVPEPGPGEVLVKVAFSGVNPTDWKSRTTAAPPPGGKSPNQDGSGTIEAVGQGVDPVLVGERVWIWEAAQNRAYGTAAEYTVVPARQTVLLGAAPSFELGAALAIPFMTAHRCLTVADDLPDRIAEGTLTGRTILVQGGAGAVGNAAIQLARWADATVIATVSSPAKAQLAAAAGADHVIDYRTQDVVHEVRKIVPHGVDTVVEVNVKANAAVDAEVLGLHGAVAIYGGDPDDTTTIPVRTQMMVNGRWQFVLVYTEPDRAKEIATEDVNAAVQVGAARVGREVGLPLTVFPLAETAAAHQAVQDGAVGKVLIDVTA